MREHAAFRLNNTSLSDIFRLGGVRTRAIYLKAEGMGILTGGARALVREGEHTVAAVAFCRNTKGNTVNVIINNNITITAIILAFGEYQSRRGVKSTVTTTSRAQIPVGARRILFRESLSFF